MRALVISQVLHVQWWTDKMKGEWVAAEGG